MAPVIATNHEMINVALATSNASGGPGGAHRFVMVDFFYHVLPHFC
jgi:hypothetical protein